jgi:hypothetical protein
MPIGPESKEYQFQPGQSGNPGGRPKGYVPFAPALRRELAKADRRNKTQMQKIAEKVVAMALKGDMDAVRWIADRVDGKVAQSIQVDSQQTIHVVPWLPALREAAEDQALLGQETIDAEATDVETLVEVESLEEEEARLDAGG